MFLYEAFVIISTLGNELKIADDKNFIDYSSVVSGVWI